MPPRSWRLAHYLPIILACLVLLALPAAAGRDEGWARLLIDGVQVGYSHDLAEDASYQGRPARHLTSDWLLSFKRSGVPVQVQGHSEVTYDADLHPLLVQELDTAQAQPITMAASWDGKAWVITRGMAGRKTEKHWQPDRPAYSLELVPLLVIRDSAQPGGTRHYPVYDFQKLQVVDTSVQVTLAPGPLHSGEVPYARLDYTVMDEPISEWIDQQGNTLKAAHASFEAYNCTREQAEQFEVKELLPLEVATVKLSHPLPEPMELADVKLKVHFPNATMAKTLIQTDTQLILNQQQGDLLVELREPIGADPQSTRMAAVTPSLKPFLTADDHIQSDDPAIIAQARAAIAGEQQPVRMADRLTEWVHENVDYTLEVLLTSALATYTSHRGDCKGYSALLTAMARAVGLPAREVFGLAYDPPHQSFAGHAWTEIFLGGRWIPYDATAGRMPTATYIQLRDLSPMDALYHIRDMRIDVVELKRHREM